MEMAPYLLLGMFVSGLISIFIDNYFVTKHIVQKNINKSVLIERIESKGFSIKD